jgi:hypothetical protein
MTKFNGTHNTNKVTKRKALFDMLATVLPRMKAAPTKTENLATIPRMVSIFSE